MELFQRLGHIPPFQQIPSEYLMTLTPFIQQRRYRNGENVYEPGIPRNRVYLLEEGDVVLYDVIEGHEETMAIFHAPDIVSSRSLFDGTSHHVHRVMVHSSQATVLELPTEGVQEVLNRYPQMAKWLYESLVPILESRLYYANRKLTTLYRTGNVTRRAQTVRELAEGILDIVLTSNQATKGYIALNSLFDLAQLKLYASHGYDAVHGVASIVKANDDPLLRNVWERRTTVVIRSPEDQAAKDVQSWSWSTTAVASPIIVNQKMRGVILLADRQGKALTENAALVLGVVAEQVGQTIDAMEHHSERTAREELKRVYVDPYLGSG